MKQKKVVIYDGECGFCDLCKRLCLRIDIKKCLSFIPYQQNRYGLSVENVQASVWAKVDNEYYAGAEAISVIIDTLIGTTFIHRVYKVPGIRGISDWAYRLIARHRNHLLWKHSSCSVSA